MGWFISNFLGGLVRWAVTAVVAGACLMLGFSPESWIKDVVESPPAWLVHDFTRLSLVVIAVVVIVGVFFWDRTIKQKKQQTALIRHQEASPRRLMRLSDALYWIIDNSNWGPGLGRDSFLELAAITLRQAARDGEITIRGRRKFPGYEPDGQFDKTWDDIEQSYWRTHEFEMTVVMCAEPHYATCETVVVPSADANAEILTHYGMLRVWNDELEKRWPVDNT